MTKSTWLGTREKNHGFCEGRREALSPGLAWEAREGAGRRVPHAETSGVGLGIEQVNLRSSRSRAATACEPSTGGKAGAASEAGKVGSELGLERRRALQFVVIPFQGFQRTDITATKNPSGLPSLSTGQVEGRENSCVSEGVREKSLELIT